MSGSFAALMMAITIALRGMLGRRAGPDDDDDPAVPAGDDGGEVLVDDVTEFAQEIPSRVARHTRPAAGRLMKIGAAGVTLIKEFEGFPQGGRPYQDPVGIWTIDYGHTERVGPNTPPITEQQASQLLTRDLDRKYAPTVDALAVRSIGTCPVSASIIG